MREHVTLVRPGAPAPGARALSSAFPPDLFEQARGRIRLLAGFFVVAFSFDLTVYTGVQVFALLTGRPMPPELVGVAPFQWANFGAAAASAGLWWAAGRRRLAAPRLHTIGLTYEVAICFFTAMLTYWQYYADTGLLPNLTWVPAIVIMFPLVLPGPPPRMVAAALASAATSPLALLLLHASGKVEVADGGAYVQATVGPLFAVGFAYLGSRVIYGLGREVARARALGSYQLEELLGEGGMGEVWRARHRLLARPAAVKLIRPSLTGNRTPGASDEAMRRFEREAQVIAGLRSPHTVTLFDFGMADDGSFYYAMELLDGLDAQALVRRFGPVPAERAVHLLRQVCHSLSEAESRGLVHRDIKPANVFLCRYGEDHDFVKVLDFGIVKMRHDTAAAVGGLTSAHVVHGTPSFIAPEQALGDAQVDGRADIYATGCVAYWLLTGQLVFTADTSAALLMHHVRTPPAAPSTRTELPIPASLDRLVLACLAKDPGERPQTARELAQGLADVEGAGAWTEERSAEWWGRHLPAEVQGARSSSMTSLAR
jgi:serine/threonine-protein kinase